MNNTIRTVAIAVTAIGLATACNSTSDTGAKGSSATSASTASAASSAAPASAAQLQALVPAPAGASQTYGPDPISSNGIHLRYEVKGTPADVVTAYKSALQGKGWTVTTIVSSTGGPGGGGGATYTGTHGDNYGVFDGGGFGDTTYLNVCTWPTKPVEPNCSRSGQK